LFIYISIIKINLPALKKTSLSADNDRNDVGIDVDICHSFEYYYSVFKVFDKLKY